jgi:predicted transcriptional regulator
MTLSREESKSNLQARDKYLFNTFSYHLKKLVTKNLLEKRGKKYLLTQKSRLWMEKKRSLEALLLDSGVIVPPRYT